MTSEQLLAADRQAADDALEAGPEAIMAGAADREAGPAVLADLLAHELAAGHRLMLRLAAAADAVLDWGADEPAAAERSAAELAAGRLAAAASRLMEQLRQGLVALRRFRPDAEEAASGSPCAGSRSAAPRRSWSAASPPPRPRRPPMIRRRRA